MALPFKVGFSRVYRIFTETGVADQVVFVGSGKLGFPHSALLALSLGCDLNNVGREAMLAIGCIQAQRCHTNHCPTGIATQNWWLTGGLNPALKSVRLANYYRFAQTDTAGVGTDLRCGAPEPGHAGSA